MLFFLFKESHQPPSFPKNRNSPTLQYYIALERRVVYVMEIFFMLFRVERLWRAFIPLAGMEKSGWSFWNEYFIWFLARISLFCSDFFLCLMIYWYICEGGYSKFSSCVTVELIYYIIFKRNWCFAQIPMYKIYSFFYYYLL